MLKNLETFEEPEGVLAPIEFNNLPFIPKRVFYVTSVPKNAYRGGHAHFNTQQVLVCLQGSISVELIDYYGTRFYRLKPNQSLFIDKMVWDSQIFNTGNDVMLSICSTHYDKNDYIEDFDKFCDLIDSLYNSEYQI